MYNLQLKAPLQLFVNGKFVCNIDEMQVIHNSPEYKKDVGRKAGGTVINILKAEAPTPDEVKKQEEDSKSKDYDEFFRRMSRIPEMHEKIDW
jgi:hypothetical protein